MAVVSISRIQVRRGRKNQGSGLPQLASGEFGWAIDAQELYIGNGSVAEGAPYVGNTKILTETDDLFSVVKNYQYRKDDAFIQTGTNANFPVLRSLQERLDDYVSIRSFGADGDGSDQTQEIQQALFTLFLNSATSSNPKSRVVLHLDPGTYKISSTLFIPPYTNIQGAGSEKTVLEFTGTGPAFVTVNSTFLNSIPQQSTSDNQSRSISMSGFTIESKTRSVVFRLDNCRNSNFKNIKLKGLWSNGDTGFSDSAFEFVNLSKAVSCHSNFFENIIIEKFSYAVFADGDIYDNSWNNCAIKNTEYGIVFGKNAIIGSVGQTTGPTNNSISNSIFDDIDKNAILIANGKNNSSVNNKFYDVGNAGGTSSNASFPVLDFNDDRNVSINDWFKRTAELAYDQEFIVNVPYIPEVASNSIVDLKYTNRLKIGFLPQSQRLLRLPLDRSSGYEIEYFYTSNAQNATRQGTLRLAVNVNTGQKQLSDDYEYAGDSNWAESLKFTTEIFDENGDGLVDTAAIMVVNSLLNDDADFFYRVKIK